MRVIKCRAWDKNSSRMLSWEEIQNDEQYFRFLDGEKYTKMVIMLYTDLKDRHGEEICEGDIMRDEFYPRWKEVVEVKRVTDRYLEDEVALGYDLRWEKMEVIGNIYENEEFL